MEKFTKKYIKMCEKAKEIQRIWKPKLEDWVYDEYAKNWVGKSIYVLGCEWAQIEKNKDFSNYRQIYKVIWLPTLEQLQEIYCQEYEGGKDMWDAFYEFFYGKKLYIEDVIGFYDTKAIWLAFVMWKRYKKVWDYKKEDRVL